MGQHKEEQSTGAARLHIFLDGFGWSEDRKADLNQLLFVRGALELPHMCEDCLITVFNCSDIGDLEQLRDMLDELIARMKRG